MNLKEFLVLQKFRFDMAVAFLIIINFALLIVANSPKVEAIFSIKVTPTIMLLLILSAFFIMWGFGIFLDKIRYIHLKLKITAERNPVMVEILERIRRLEGKV